MLKLALTTGLVPRLIGDTLSYFDGQDSLLGPVLPTSRHANCSSPCELMPSPFFESSTHVSRTVHCTQDARTRAVAYVAGSYHEAWELGPRESFSSHEAVNARNSRIWRTEDEPLGRQSCLKCTDNYIATYD